MIEIDPSSAVPLYLQIAGQMRWLIAMGALKPGDRVPAVRDLAVATRVNRNTAARAIQHLEAEGVVRTRVGQGTFVEDSAPKIDRAARDRSIDALLDGVLVEARTVGFPLEELGRRLSKRIEEFLRRWQTHESTGGERESE